MPSALHPERLSTYLLAVLLVTAGVRVPAVAGSASAAEPHVTFDDAVSHEQRGDVLEIGVSLSGTDAATVRVGPGEKHSATVVVRDEDGDGRATVLLNTYDWTFRASDGDNLTVRRPPGGPLVPAGESRSIVVRPGPDTDRDPTDIGTLVVDERSTHDLRTWVVPESADLSNLSAMNAAKALGILTRSETVTRNDTLVLELRASGLEGVLTARSEANATARFFGLLEEDAADLEAVQINPGPSIPPKEIRLADHDSTDLFADSANDSYYLVADLSDVNVTGRNGDIVAGDEYEANFSLAGSSEFASNGTESVETEFGVVESRNRTTADPTTTDSTTTDRTPATDSTTDVPMREETPETRTATPGAAEPTTPGNDGDIPGFGAAPALVALLAAVLLVRRRK